MEPEAKLLSELVDQRQAAGRYVLSRAEALQATGKSAGALKKAVQRLVTKRRLIVPRRGFFVIVPLEERVALAPPPSWFIDQLMRFEGRPYYVGLYAAAALQGAGHQQPQELQVFTNVQMRTIHAGRGRIRFFVKRTVALTPVLKMNTPTGQICVSTPEATALDLMRYGQLDSAATVLAELHQRMAGVRLVEAAERAGDIPSAQRLGHLLEQLAAASGLLEPLERWLSGKRRRHVRLRPDKPAGAAPLDRRWSVWVNEVLEPDDL